MKMSTNNLNNSIHLPPQIDDLSAPIVEQKEAKINKSTSNQAAELNIGEINIPIGELPEPEEMVELDYCPNDISIRVFDTARPVAGKDYFIKTTNIEKSGVGVIFPFFNEPNHELQQSLNSLHKSWNYLRSVSDKWKNKPLHVCLIQDGWNRADPSMKEYLKLLFPKKVEGTDKYWWDYYKDFNPNSTDDNSEKGVPRTYIFQTKNHRSTNINPQKGLEDTIVNMKITLIIKSQNHRKHNSHEWFFGDNSFGESINSEYLFLTDAFTLYNKTCLYHLIKTLDDDPNCVAVTGRQRAMSAKQQGTTESIFSMSHVMRDVQLCDFESSNAIYNGAFSIGGLLPVIPGPCGMYRSECLLNDDMRKEYFGVLNDDEKKKKIVIANLAIAEDRWLTYLALIFFPRKGVYMKFNPLAIFYFESESTLEKFFLQRRRWINGSVAGYIYLLFFQFSKFWNWKANPFRKFYVWILLFFQFVSYMLVSIAPAVSIRITYYGVNYFLNFYGVDVIFDFVIVGILLWAIYFAHVIIHNNFSRFNSLIVNVILLPLSILTSLISIISLFHYAFIYQGLSITDVIFSGNVIVYLGLFVFLGPFIISMLLSGKSHSTLYLLKSFVPYYLLLPMQIAWLGSYSYARIWDVSWGNRPTGDHGNASDEARKKITTSFKNISWVVTGILFIVNLAVFFVPLQGQLAIIGIYYVTAAYQICWSIIYCLIQIYYKLSFVATNWKNRLFKKKDQVNDNLDFEA